MVVFSWFPGDITGYFLGIPWYTMLDRPKRVISYMANLAKMMFPEWDSSCTDGCWTGDWTNPGEWHLWQMWLVRKGWKIGQGNLGNFPAQIVPTRPIHWHFCTFASDCIPMYHLLMLIGMNYRSHCLFLWLCLKIISWNKGKVKENLGPPCKVLIREEFHWIGFSPFARSLHPILEGFQSRCSLDLVHGLHMPCVPAASFT